MPATQTPVSQITASHATAGPSSRRLLRRLHTEDDGAQAMEYTALAAGGCGVVGIIITLLQTDGVLETIAGGIVSVAERIFGSFGGLF